MVGANNELKLMIEGWNKDHLEDICEKCSTRSSGSLKKVFSYPVDLVLHFRRFLRRFFSYPVDLVLHFSQSFLVSLKVYIYSLGLQTLTRDPRIVQSFKDERYRACLLIE
jgi:hypothetical protein